MSIGRQQQQQHDILLHILLIFLIILLIQCSTIFARLQNLLLLQISMNAAMQVINVTQMRTVPTLLVLTAVLVRKGLLEMDIHAQVEQ